MELNSFAPISDEECEPIDPEIIAGHKRGELHASLCRLVAEHGLEEVDATLLVVKDDLEGGVA